jgi:hypothetical protein
MASVGDDGGRGNGRGGRIVSFPDPIGLDYEMALVVWGFLERGAEAVRFFERPRAEQSLIWRAAARLVARQEEARQALLRHEERPAEAAGRRLAGVGRGQGEGSPHLVAWMGGAAPAAAAGDRADLSEVPPIDRPGHHPHRDRPRPYRPRPQKTGSAMTTPDGAQGRFSFAMGSVPCTHPTRMLKWRVLATSGEHLGSYCRRCGKWLRWLPQNRETLAQAPPRPARGTA